MTRGANRGFGVNTIRGNMKQESQEELTALVRELGDSLRVNEVVIFAGAGVSLSGGLPTATHLVERSVEAILARGDLPEETKELARNVIPAGVRLEVFLHALTEILGRDGLLPLQLLGGGSPGAAHRFAANMFKLGFLRYLVTTNFDTLFEQGCTQESVSPHVLVTEDDYESWLHSPQWPAILKLHGSLGGSGQIQADLRQVARGLGGTKTAVLKNLLESNTVLFVGYSGRDFFGAMPVVFASNYRRIIWVEHLVQDHDSPGNKVVAKWLGARSEGRYVITDTDHFLQSLCDYLHITCSSELKADATPLPDPFGDSCSLPRGACDIAIGRLLSWVGRRDEVYDCYTTALQHLSLPEHSALIARCHMFCADIALSGLRGSVQEMLGMQHAEAALRVCRAGKCALGLQLKAQLMVYDATMSLAVPYGKDVRHIESLIDHVYRLAEIVGEHTVCAYACRLEADFFRLFANGERPDHLLRSLFLDAEEHLADLAAQDLLFMIHAQLVELHQRAGAVAKELEYRVKHLRSVLILSQDPDCEAVRSCVQAMRERIVRIGGGSAAAREATRSVANLGFQI